MNQTVHEGRNFEESLLQLERTIHELEEGRLSLEEALARYEQGVGLIKFCYQQLQGAEQRILLLSGADEAGQPVLQPFRHEATAPAKAAPGPRLRRGNGEMF